MNFDFTIPGAWLINKQWQALIELSPGLCYVIGSVHKGITCTEEEARKYFDSTLSGGLREKWVASGCLVDFAPVHSLFSVN